MLKILKIPKLIRLLEGGAKVSVELESRKLNAAAIVKVNSVK
jgi:hypothetical protein